MKDDSTVKWCENAENAEKIGTSRESFKPLVIPLGIKVVNN